MSKSSSPPKGRNLGDKQFYYFTEPITWHSPTLSWAAARSQRAWQARAREDSRVTDETTLTAEFDDGDEQSRWDWSRFRLSRLLHPRAVQHLAGLVLALVVLAWPGRTEIVVGRLIGVTLVLYGTAHLWAAVKARPLPAAAVAGSIVALAFGGFAVVVPVETQTAVGRLLGGVLMVKGVWELVAALLRQRSDLWWRLASASALIAVGSVVLAFPTALLGILIASIACVWLVMESISLSVLLNPSHDERVLNSDTSLVGQWFADRPKAEKDRRRLYGELLFEGKQSSRKVTRFAMLMVFSSVIAALGVVADSTAVVVGAMLIAPLMTPLMAMALSLVMGWPIDSLAPRSSRSVAPCWRSASASS